MKAPRHHEQLPDGPHYFLAPLRDMAVIAGIVLAMFMAGLLCLALADLKGTLP